MQRIRYLFALKSILVPITALAMLIWAFKRTNGGGPIFQQESTISGSKKTWIFMSSLNSVLGNFAPLTVNIPDFTRYAAGPRYQYIQLLIIPLAFSFFAFVGIVVTSASKTIYGGDYIWDPMQLMSLWDNRAATFLSAFSLALATLGTNISANSISAANDFTALYPQLINMRRGQILVSFIGGWCLVVCCLNFWLLN
ncbi:putative permease [Neolecta irregularis DAH-3]|uniref:Putative permease n=1 Tax=Neolecta irregularis (strain DAH-3) TaxID=1198029 RepID=A0A1U7LS38_NEOID|nr:putative permease [Neolecta irregularis DAH-3]|eukprot:OLL25477.1 putative permease [Neolecta irregularis DAH-3]